MSTRREISPISRWVLEGLSLLEIPYILIGRFQKSALPCLRDFDDQCRKSRTSDCMFNEAL
jgi:hypothetical protein